MSSQSVTQATSSTLVALLNSVNVMAQQTARTVTTATSSLDMLDAFVQKAKQEQADRYLEAARTFREDLINESAIANARKKKQLMTELSHDSELAAIFQAEQAAIKALFT